MQIWSNFNFYSLFRLETEDGCTCIDLTNNTHLQNLIKQKKSTKNSMRPPLIVGLIKKTSYLMFKVKEL
jgi:hypothetical protein